MAIPCFLTQTYSSLRVSVSRFRCGFRDILGQVFVSLRNRLAFIFNHLRLRAAQDSRSAAFSGASSFSSSLSVAVLACCACCMQLR